MNVPNEIDALINDSGHSFHSKVARWFVEDDWHVIVSPYYFDQSQGKARELDLVAEKVLAPIDGVSKRIGSVVVRLFIECKYVATHSVFWFADKDMERAADLVRASGQFWKSQTNIYTQKHHYLAYCHEVAKIFASSRNKQTENDQFYKALNQVLNATVSLQGRPIAIPQLKKNHGTLTVLAFPVVVCNSFDKLYATLFYSSSSPTQVTENFQLEVDYAYLAFNGNAVNRYLLIDFVELAKLSDFVGVLKKDAGAAGELLSL